MSTTEINVNAISEALNDKMDRDFGNRLKNFVVNGAISAPIPDWSNSQDRSYNVLYTADQDGYFIGGGYVVSASAGLLVYMDGSHQVYEWNCIDANGSGTWFILIPKGHTYKATGGHTSQWCKFLPLVQSSATVSLV